MARQGLSKRQEAALAAFDILTAYLTDECPDSEMWEEFDPVMDGLRAVLDDLLQER